MELADRLHTLFDETTKFLVEASDAVISYAQSDEITLLLYNGGTPERASWPSR